MPEPAHSWLSVRLLLGVPFQRAVCHFSRGLRSRKPELSQPFRLLFAATPFIVGDFVRKTSTAAARWPTVGVRLIRDTIISIFVSVSGYMVIRREDSNAWLPFARR